MSCDPSCDPKRRRARELAASHLARGDAIGWFEALYVQASGDADQVPWADLCPNPHLVEWAVAKSIQGQGRAGLLVGCGLGDDAEYLAGRGFQVTAFDISPSAVSWCKKRFPTSAVAWQTGDLLSLPPGWRQMFDFVLEAYTLQVLPIELRTQALPGMAETLRPGGTMLVICRGRRPEDDAGQMPWPLTREELSALERCGLLVESFEEFWDRT